VSTTAISPLSLLENSLATITPSNPNQTTLTNASTVNAASKITNDTSGNSDNTVTQDTVTLLKDLAQGDTAAANTDAGKLKTDLQDQSASNTSTKINQDVTSLIKALTGGNNADANSELTNLKADLQTQDLSTANIKSTSSQNVSPLATLLNKVTDNLNTGSVQGALEDLAGYLVQNGQVTGSLLNVSA
jgi:DNA polymerase III delta subunit